MPSETIRVDVCIATCKRPDLLKKLMESLVAQRLAEQVEVRIIVVDNDRTCSARPTVEEFAAHSPWPVVYDMEPERNISLARNRSVRHATGDYLAFIDDDETADPDWLEELLGALQRFGADAVCGPVLPVLPPDAPAWAADGRLYRRPRHRSGTALKTGATNNMLIRAGRLIAYPEPFDPAYGRSGGEDHDLCRRLLRDGGKLVWCDTAVVCEHLGRERLTVRYLVRRSLLGGRVFARREAKGRHFPHTVCWFAYRALIVSATSPALIILWPLHRVWGIRLLMKVCSNLGQLSILIARGGDNFYAAD